MQPIRFDLGDLQAMVAVVEQGGFRAAAEALSLSQPALSRRIDKLEQALNVRLFERTTRRVTLTVVGREFVGKARALLAEVESSLMGIGDAAATRSGEVTVACVPSAAHYFLPAVIARFHAQFPNVRVKMVDEGANVVLHSVASGEADFGLNFIGTQEADLLFEPLLRDPFVLACRHDHPLARRRSVKWAELGAHTLVALAKSSGNRLMLDLALAELPLRPAAFYEVRHVSSVLALVEAGLGVAAVPRLALPGGERATLVAVPLRDPAVSRTLGILRRRGRTLPAHAQALYDMVGQAVTRRGRSAATSEQGRGGGTGIDA
ncbi:LysR family transcriptional regulator [Cupriavidus basilensis]|uniref:LysR family transcriptional regulator n=1 Tax=Cupriavidus basilensis TaxID=68895 RepID=UPI00157B758F|nr:LysR family transcriptional regulator [Cupriavidus basilensis]NUA26581.1 LysR family transcriptional regulator [Cupriavidus basilensis]